MRFERNEYPRPQFRRDDWQNLNGEWDFCFDDENKGLSAGYPQTGVKGRKINVPFAYQTEASGIFDDSVHEIVWYSRTFTCKENRRVYLNFGGVDHDADVYVNGTHVCSHRGAYAPFGCDITAYVRDGENLLVVRAEDRNSDLQPRGKQSWTGNTFACWYVATTGIWQSVWLEYFGEDRIEKYSLRPDRDKAAFFGEITTLYHQADTLKITAKNEGGEVLAEQTVGLENKSAKFAVYLPKGFRDDYTWWVDRPILIYFDFTLLKNGTIVDEAHTRSGLRKISVDDSGIICLNGCPLYQRLILDQGYWKETGITPPSAEALKKDIELAKAMGFNGARKHQKAEDPYFCYYAEELGFLTWCEMPSAYRFDAEEVKNLTAEWQEIIEVAKNCTSNICYVPLNESWGTREIVTSEEQKNFARSLYYLTKSLDPEKLISTNDGFETVNPTDILGVHDYDSELPEHFRKYEGGYDGMHPQGYALFADGEKYRGEPVLLTEFGGRAFQKDQQGDAWGYSGAASDEESFLKQLEGIMKGVYSRPFQGFCYTQLTDVQQEVNGLLYADRTPKVDMERLKNIFRNRQS